MKHLADTTLLVDHLRGNKDATLFLIEQTPAVSIVTMAELIQGVKQKRALRDIDKLSRSLTVIPISETVSKKALGYIQQYFLSHRLEFLDALIAATAIEEKLTLVTGNTKHFSFIKDLKILEWKKISTSFQTS